MYMSVAMYLGLSTQLTASKRCFFRLDSPNQLTALKVEPTERRTEIRSGDDGDSSGEEGEGEEKEGGLTDQKEEGDTRSRLHEPPDNQLSKPSTSSLPSMDSEHSLGLPDDETSMDIPVSSVLPCPHCDPPISQGE